MIDCKCSFAATLITEEYACEKAQLVTRRGGPDIACASEEGSQYCKNLYQQFKAVGLPAFDAEDDLLKTPASVFNKIQFGGLLALSKIIVLDDVEVVDNIFDLARQAEKKFEGLENIPFDQFVDNMRKFKIKRNKKLKK